MKKRKGGAIDPGHISSRGSDGNDVQIMVNEWERKRTGDS